MKFAVRVASLLLGLLAVGPWVSAQDTSDAQVTVVHPGFDGLKHDLKRILALTSKQEQEQWENIEGYIDTFVVGSDGSRPVQVQVMTGTDPVCFLIFVPLSDSKPLFKDFRENIESLGYEVTRDSKDQTLYKLSQDPEFGWLRVMADINYAVFVLTQDQELFPKLKDLILKAQLREVSMEGNMVAELKNTALGAEAVGHRRESFGGLRNPAMERIQKRPEESGTEYELRKLGTKLFMDEGERGVAETELLRLFLTVEGTEDLAEKTILRSSIKAIEGTELATTIAEFGTTPDAFASIKKFEGSALSFRLNHPIDAMRKTNFTEFLDLTQKDMTARIAESSERSASEKDAANKVVTGVIGILKSSISSGWFNAFAEAVPDGKGDFMSVVAYTSPNAKDLNTILPDLAKAGAGTIVELNVDKAGSVDIHRVQLAPGLIDMFDNVFGARRDIFVGVGDNQIWMASGEGAKDRLKQTISDLGAPASTTSPLHLELKLLPFAKRFDEIAKKKEKPKDADELELWRAAERRRARAIAAYEEGNDNISLDFQFAQGQLTGELIVDTGMLRFVGKMMSAFSKENFE